MQQQLLQCNNATITSFIQRCDLSRFPSLREHHCHDCNEQFICFHKEGTIIGIATFGIIALILSTTVARFLRPSSLEGQNTLHLGLCEKEQSSLKVFFEKSRGTCGKQDLNYSATNTKHFLNLSATSDILSPPIPPTLCLLHVPNARQ